MAEPLTTSTATIGAAAGWGLVASVFIGFITSIDYGVAAGALGGSIIVVATTPGLTRWQSAGYFIFSYIAGIVGAGFTADWIENTVNYREKPLDSMSAFIISTAAVHCYFWLKNGGLMRLPFIKKWLGVNDNAK